MRLIAAIGAVLACVHTSAVELKNGAQFALEGMPTELTAQVKRGGAVRLLLEENGTTGYQWFATYASNECSVAIEHRGANAEGGLCGAPGKAAISIAKNASVQSPSLIEFAYRRGWEKDASPAKTIRLVLYTIPGGEVDFKYPASRTLAMLKTECKNRGIELIDWHVHIRGGLTPEMAAEREKACGFRQSAMENHGREWEIFDNARLAEFADRARTIKINGHTLPVGIQVNDRDWFRQINAETRAKFDYILADTMIMGKLPNGRDRRLWLVKDIAEIGDPEKWMDEYVSMNLQILGEPISILANPGYLPMPLDGMREQLWTDERMRAVISKAVERGIAIEIQAESPYPSPRFLRMAKAMGAKFSFGTNNYDAAPKDLSRWLEAIVWLDLKGKDIWQPSMLVRETAAKASCRIVVNPQSFDSAALASPELMGRKHWIISSGKYADPAWKLTDAERASGIAELPVFRECALERSAGGKQGPADPKVATWRTMAENFKGGTNGQHWIASESNTCRDRPLFSACWAKRSYNAQVGAIDLDYDDFRAWLKRHPNLVGFFMLDEWENDVVGFKNRLKHWKTQGERDELIARLYSFPDTRDGLLQRLHAHFDRQIAMYYNATNLCIALRHTHATDHIAAAWGAKFICLETTCTTSQCDDEFRWDVQGMFARGAARQFNLPWSWYTAIYYNSYSTAGKFIPYSNCWYDPPADVRKSQPNSRPEGGISPSLLNRGWYYAYLNGAGFQQVEQWHNYLTCLGTNGIPRLTKQGENFTRFYDFTKANPGRGEPYTPVAVLTPFNLGYSAWGGVTWRGESKDYTPGDAMVDAVFFTVVPGRHRGAELKRGIENCLHNSPYAMMYDVLVPDSPQVPTEFLARLKAYPAAILAGTYPNVAAFWPTMVKYMTEGGTLLVNRANVPATELARLAQKPCAAISDDGGSRLADAYELGRGRLIVSVSDWMVPKIGPDIWKESGMALSGERKFPEMEFFINRFQDELFPFVVRGDCQYGACKTPGGWWLWTINNRGVTKFADAFERVDETKKSEITVDLRCDDCRVVGELLTGRSVEVEDGKFHFTIPAGQLAIFEIKN